jgi:hypothetical protein
VELENPKKFPLALASRGDTEITADKVRLPSNSIAILVAEKA